ncbi:MAG: three-Cys-motif partner protein TcmP [Waterburya sp.]
MFRKGHVWTADKLEFLENYIPAFKKATQKAFNTHYVDGFAGPGINDIEGKKCQGSPLIALNSNPPFTKYFFIEQDRQTYHFLSRTVEAHQYVKQVSLFNDDFNSVARKILEKIPDRSPTLFFLDPEGLELEWSTVELISQRTKADLFLLISSSGVNRNVHDIAMHDKITKFYGTDEWRKILEKLEKGEYPTDTKRFEAFTDFYIERLNQVGFVHAQQFLIARNSRNVALHALVFAVKSDRGEPVALRIAESVLKNLQTGNQGTLF